jgi:hypothetical protein
MEPDLFGHTPETIIHQPPCQCGCDEFILEGGQGPHAAHLRCAECGRGGRWMSRAECEYRKLG